MYLSPSAGTYAGGATITVEIREDSGAVAVNAAQANLSYPVSLLQFQSIDTSGSPFTTTIQSNGGSGSVELGVGILAGSTTGEQLVGTVSFTVIGAGSATINFADGSGLARADTSTDICNRKDGAAYTLAS